MKNRNTLLLSTIGTIVVLTAIVLANGMLKRASIVNAVPSNSAATVAVDIDTINSKSIDNLVDSAQIIAVGSIAPSQEFVNMARNPDNRAEPDDSLYIVGQVYQFKVESYIYGAGSEILNVVQPEGLITGVDTSTLSPDQAQSAKGRGYPFVPLTSGQYLMFLERLDGFPDTYVTGSGGSPWRFKLTGDVAEPESAEPELNQQFKPAKKNDLVKLIKDLLKAKGK